MPCWLSRARQAKAFGLLTNDREFADHNRELLMDWMAVWVPRAIPAARTLQPLWSQPEAKPPRFEDGLDAAKNRFAGIVTDLNRGDRAPAAREIWTNPYFARGMLWH